MARAAREPAATPGATLQSEVLLVPHHGSRTSSTRELLEQLRPRWSVVQAGYRNRFGHPAPELLQRLQERGIPWEASPDCGAASWRSASPQQVECWRHSHRRYWQSGAIADRN